MSFAGAMRTLRVHLSGDTRRPFAPAFHEPLRGANALEIGGPTAGFGAGGVLPVYPLMGRIDGVQPAAHTAWHELDAAKGYVLEGRRRGELYISDDVSLGDLADASYDAVFCSHVIEHIANPLRALAAWRRVSGPGRRLLLVAPHMEGSFDHLRELTPLGHMVADLEQDTREDDLTHLDEFLRLHDESRNIRGQRDPGFVADLRDNARTRLMHHHTFTTLSLLELLCHAGLQPDAVEARLPHDIFVAGRWLPDGEQGDSSSFTEQLARSPFASDREAARGIVGGGRA